MPVGAFLGAARVAAIAFVAIAATPLRPAPDRAPARARIAPVVACGVDREGVARMVAFRRRARSVARPA